VDLSIVRVKSTEGAVQTNERKKTRSRAEAVKAVGLPRDSLVGSTTLYLLALQRNKLTFFFVFLACLRSTSSLSLPTVKRERRNPIILCLTICEWREKRMGRKRGFNKGVVATL
jgi:hypothetical protein